ncbi:hypothetical protein VTI28DRAFT_10443 [Corynascus sepedonium]
MMDCSCRTAALRIFVRSIAQIHVPPRTPSRAAQYQLLSNQPNRVYTARTNTVLATTSRALHTSCARSSATEGVQVVVRGERGDGASKHEVTDSQAAADRSIESGKEDTPLGASSIAQSRNIEYHDKPAAGSLKKASNPQSKQEPSSHQESSDWARPNREKEPWRIQKEALKKKFPGGWNPRKKLSPDALVGIRMLHQQFPDEYTTEVLASKFEVSPEAIRRILKSKWTPDPETEAERQERWFKRGKRVWTQWAALGKKPPRRWRAEGIVRDPVWNKPRGPNHKDTAARAEAQRRLAKGLMG